MSPRTDLVGFFSVLVATMWLGFTPFSIDACHPAHREPQPGHVGPRCRRHDAARPGWCGRRDPPDGPVRRNPGRARGETEPGGGKDVDKGSDLKPAKFDLDNTAIMLHLSGTSRSRACLLLWASSRPVFLGSTSFPKRIRMLHWTLLQYTMLSGAFVRFSPIQ